jgi:HAD superfamily hydrolase (TIGR01509 family)
MSNLKTPIQAIIFDVDGVLLDTNQIHHLAWQKVFATQNKSYTYQDYLKKGSGIHRHEVIAHLKPNPSEEDLAHFSRQKDLFTQEIVDTRGVEPLEKVLEFIDFLRTKYKVAAASSSKNAPNLLAKSALSTKLDSIRGGAQITNPKPHPEIYLNSALEIGIDPKACLVIEDMSVGVLAAKNAGMRSCGLTHTGDTEIATLAEFSVYNLIQYPKIIEFFGL